MKGREQGGSSVTLSRVLGQVARQLRDGRVAQEERQRQWQAVTAELDAARGEAARLYQALEERKAAVSKLEEEAREAVERAEGAERETTELRERVLELENSIFSKEHEVELLKSQLLLVESDLETFRDQSGLAETKISKLHRFVQVRLI